MIYTSYFAKIRNIPDNIVPVSICAKPPAYYKGKQYKTLAPTYQCLMDYKKDKDEIKYRYRYYSEVLNRLKVTEVVNSLYSLSEGNDVVLLCYEKPGDFCHRHLVSEWLKREGIEAREYE